MEANQRKLRENFLRDTDLMVLRETLANIYQMGIPKIGGGLKFTKEQEKAITFFEGELKKIAKERYSLELYDLNRSL